MSQTMNWESLLSTRRFKIIQNEVRETRTPATQEGGSGLRTDFHIDHDRVVFSSAFRRLGRKTQVHPLARHDHTHNRLTHSVEVASVGRSLGNRVGVMLEHDGLLPAGYTPHDIGAVVQVACLAHDIGNPPFGHTGEYALRDWFRDERNAHWLNGLSAAEIRDVQTYEGNAHGLRMLATLEMYSGEGGMRLTSAALGTLIKYPWTADAQPAYERDKFNIYRTELPYFERVAEELGLLRHGPLQWSRHPLSYLMEAADDICYAILDLEDAVEIGILDFKEFETLFSGFSEHERVWGMHDVRQKCGTLRGVAIGRCVTEVAEKFMMHHPSLLRGEFPAKDLINLCDPAVQDALLQAKELASHKVYRHRTKLVTELASYPCIATILNVLVPAVHASVTKDDKELTPREHLAMGLLEGHIQTGDSLYQAYMKVLDFVGAMTDNYAANLARELSGVGIL
ncbi:deoxyguanosinetriphosphate triphosphohydrolase [Pseudogulbenkiania ferrooxidans]|uniref:Deoxyguanosinetriphosphate triphosphohydrolase n=1 Tax=Pseudogulbenkiania ferrooxidans EGD-HP2 TaxID=1388764 RepID=A0ABN0NBS0_9NEIS|nr:deoxyguanosinetriphosphate triphosphohydrolase [Pseudogulbenkiania ferrooxidans]ERE19848.1 deoxyguanosinetriphosphate triphosphohydrolase [Pseudogulbenkiania ferrooxidans EGD-HP2]